MTAEAIVYIRYSDPRQEKGESLSRQEELTQQFCDRHGLTIVERVYDLGRSAWKGHHLRDGNLGKLTRRIEERLIAPGTVIVAEKFDRFARLPRRETQAWIHKVTDSGLKIGLHDPGKLYDANTSLVDDIEILLRAELAWQESDQKSGRVLDAKRRAWTRAELKEGAWVMNSRVPGWLTVRPTRDGFIVDEGRADVVRDIYRWSADGIGAPGIAKRLNDRGDLPWGKWRKDGSPNKWDTVQIRTILAHPAVEGDYVPGAVAPKRSRADPIKIEGRIVGYFPRIVDADLVEQARGGVMARKLVGNRGKGGIANLFSGLTRCGYCMGKAHIGWSTRSKNRYLRCDNAQRGRGCTNKAQFNYSGFEEAALSEVLHFAMDDRFFESTDDVARHRIEMATLTKQVADLTTKKNRWMVMFEEGDDDPAIRTRIRELNDQIKATKAEITQVEGQIIEASGAVSDVEHLKRIHNIRETLSDPDDNLRHQARAKVQKALKSVVSMVICDPADTYRGEPERTLTLSIGAGLHNVKFDNTGVVIGRVSLADAATKEDRLRRAMTMGVRRFEDQFDWFMIRKDNEPA